MDTYYCIKIYILQKVDNYTDDHCQYHHSIDNFRKLTVHSPVKTLNLRFNLIPKSVWVLVWNKHGYTMKDSTSAQRYIQTAKNWKPDFPTFYFLHVPFHTYFKVIVPNCLMLHYQDDWPHGLVVRACD
jgi:hypothetical protein